MPGTCNGKSLDATGAKVATFRDGSRGETWRLSFALVASRLFSRPCNSVATSDKIQGFLDAKRATNICITMLCIKGYIHYDGKKAPSSVEMTDFG